MPLSKEITEIASASMPINERWVIKRCRYSSDSPQKRICITTGIHGNEMMGQLIIFNIARRIQAEPNALCGTVDLYPMLNPLGLDLYERMVPMHTRLDMNRAFPGSPDGTPLENICWHIMEDVRTADLVLDIHASTDNKSELYEVRMNHEIYDTMIEEAKGLCPDLIWIYPDRTSFDSSLTGALNKEGRCAFIIEADERHRNPQIISDQVVDGIFHKMQEMGMWKGSCAADANKTIPIIHSHEDIARITCEFPGIYLPEDHIGKQVKTGEILGEIIDALEGSVLEIIRAPWSGLVFSQRSYSAVYPGTLLARIRKENHE